MYFSLFLAVSRWQNQTPARPVPAPGLTFDTPGIKYKQAVNSAQTQPLSTVCRSDQSVARTRGLWMSGDIEAVVQTCQATCFLFYWIKLPKKKKKTCLDRAQFTSAPSCLVTLLGAGHHQPVSMEILLLWFDHRQPIRTALQSQCCGCRAELLSCSCDFAHFSLKCSAVWL